MVKHAFRRASKANKGIQHEKRGILRVQDWRKIIPKMDEALKNSQGLALRSFRFIFLLQESRSISWRVGVRDGKN